MWKEIYISDSCRANCVSEHKQAQNHQILQTKRFKNRLLQFNSVNDELWFPAFAIEQQIYNLICELNKFQKQFLQYMTQKKLLQTLNFDTSGSLLSIFKLANSDAFNKLTCYDVSCINKRIDRPKNPNAAQTRAYIKELVNEQKEKLREIFDNIFNKIGEGQNSGNNKQILPLKVKEVPTRNAIPVVNPTRTNQRGNREEVKREPRNTQNQQDRPYIKVKQVEEVQGNFNIVLKVIKIKKEFTLGEGNKRKIEFEGGDQTGISNVVVDALRFIRADTVIQITNAKMYSFHGTKQIQQSLHHSFVKESDKNISVDYNYNLSERRNQRRGPQRRNKVEDTNQQNFKPKRQYQRRGGREDKGDLGDRGDRRERRERPERRQRQERVDRQQRYQQTIGVRPDIKNRQRRESSGQQKPIQQRQGMRRYGGPRSSNNEIQRRQYRNRQYESSKLQRNKNNDKTKNQSGYNSSDQAQESQKEPAKVKKQSVKAGERIFDKNLTKINELQPQMQNINLFAEIIEINSQVQVSKNCLFCIVGDQTGTVWAELPQHNPAVKVNAVIYMKSVQTEVHQQESRLIIKLNDDSLIQRNNLRMQHINLDHNMSEQQWVVEEQVDQEDQENGKKIEKSQTIIEDF